MTKVTPKFIFCFKLCGALRHVADIWRPMVCRYIIKAMQPHSKLYKRPLHSAAEAHYHNGYHGANQRQQHVAGIVLDKVDNLFAETYFFVILFHLRSTPKFFLLRLRPKAPLHNTKFREVALHRDNALPFCRALRKLYPFLHLPQWQSSWGTLP